MRFIPRHIARGLQKAARNFPALIVTGPRRSGKTTLLRRLFPRASYHLLEDPDTVARFRSDPRGFLDAVPLPAILDEVQNAPEILNYIRSRIDASPSRKGRWIITGSQEAPLMRGVTESMAGRAAIYQLLPLATSESPKVSLFRGGFPEVLARPSVANDWFSSYVQTYLERDVRAVSSIRDLSTFRRFLTLLATRCGQMLNRSELAAPLGVSVPTISEWLSILEITSQITLVPPFFENYGKRLVKSPKLYFLDSGLACHLLGIESDTMLNRSPFLGPLYEGFVAAEIIKQQLNGGRRKTLYHFRDHQGLEVDFLLTVGDRTLLLVEAKASRTVRPEMAAPLLKLAQNVGRYEVSSYVVHRPSHGAHPASAIAPGIKAVALPDLLKALNAVRG